MEEGFSYGVEPLTHANLEEFFPLYEKYISTKHNPNVHDLLALYGARIDAGEEIYFGFLRKWDVLLGGWIFIHKLVRWWNDALVLWFRAFEDQIFNKLSIWYYLEYLYFSLGLDLGITFFSRWSDRNGYWILGSNVGLPIHKAQLWFSPHLSAVNFNMLEVDESTITNDTIIIGQSDLLKDTDKLDLVNVWTKLSPEEAEKKYGIFTKRWLIVNYFYL